jgi:hypothetical protein
MDVESVGEPVTLRRKAERAVRLALEINDAEAREGLLTYAQGLIDRAKELEIEEAMPLHGVGEMRTGAVSKPDT